MAKTPAQKMELAVENRKRYWQRVQITHDLIPKLSDPKSKSQFLTRYAAVGDAYLKFEATLEIINELNTLLETDSKITDNLSSSQAMDDMYFAILEAFKGLEPELPQPAPVTQPIPGKPKLPQLNIPQFDGSFVDFSAFKSLYDTLIHSHDSLSTIEKYSYLKSLLCGPALHAIQGFPFSSDHYQVAYDTLVTRFSNKRVVASTIVNKLFSIKPFQNESQLVQFLENFNVHVESLKNLNLHNLSDFLICSLSLRLLDNNTRQAFESARPDKTAIPTYQDVLSFVEGQVAVSKLLPSTSNFKLPPIVKPAPPTKRSMVANLTPTPQEKLKLSHSCPCCSQGHRIRECPKFCSLSVSQRYQVLKDNKLCFACLGPHPRSSCHSKYSCRQCSSKSHHTLLHVDESPVTSDPTSSKQSLNALSGNACGAIEPCVSQQILLGTAIVKVKNAFGQSHDVRALIDPGSMVTIICKDLCDQLCLRLEPCTMQITGIGSSKPLHASGSLNCEVSSKHSNFTLNIEAVVMQQIASNIPSMPVAQSVVNKLASYKLADPMFYHPASIQMLIGAQYYADIMQSTKDIVPGEPSIVPSQFGYLVLGVANSQDVTQPIYHSLFISSEETELSDQLRKFWEIEEIHVKPPSDPLDVQCEKHFLDTHYRDENGVYVVRLPFRDGSPPDLGNNISHATSRLHKLEFRLERQSEFKKLYHANLQDYVDSGHMIPVNKPILPYYLTHHGVCKDSSTTRVRVVFSPAERASPSHPSLNDCLLSGPKLQNNITDIITNFRLHPVVVTADIKQMYRVIKLHPEDSKYQQILWRFSNNEPIQSYEITCVCFGVTSSPFHALRVIKQLILDEGSKYPVAAKVLDTDTFIDDICSGAASIDEARQLCDELSALLATAGFELRKWSSSHPSVLEGLSSEFLETPRRLGDVETIQVLGIQWDPTNDVFCYQIKPVPECTTKRQILSQIARTYDLPGFLSPVVIWMKILMQQIWLQGLGWDETLPELLICQWSSFVSEMPYLQTIKIPRYILDTYVYPPELVGFSDASSVAMAAVVYLRVVCSDQRVLVNMIRSKTRVAPVRPVSIPRLELEASHLLARTVESLQPLRSKLKITTLYLFTDSTVVLAWLRTPPHKLKVFVANRVVKILDVTLPTHWSHVPTNDNPADVASRGCFPSQLANHDLWWHGPSFLTKDHESWPKHESMPVEEVPELKLSAMTAHVIVSSDGIALIERFSTYSRAQRVIAWILRFKSNCLCKPYDRLLGSLKVSELNQAEHVMIRTTQNFHYATTFQSLHKGENLPPSLSQLSPYVDSSNQLLRVGGRIDKSPLPFDSRHPYLLPASSHLAKLLVSYFHILSVHGGPKLVQNLVQAKFFIPGLRNLIRKTIHKCIPCYRVNAKPRQPFMAELPISRFVQGRPFIHTGVDLAGPFSLKDGLRRNAPIIKAYFAIFVCFAVKAVHLEPLTSLSTPCFLACLDRFIARRGLPSSMFSDQGTNFKGAARLMSETHRFLLANTSAISDHLSIQHIQWSFNAPANPSAGGLWEAGVKSCKHHLKFLLNDRPLLLEEFQTVLCRTESILNSRPLGVPSTLSPEDTPDCLTPGHFLIGAPLLARPEIDVTETPSNRLPRWEFLSKVCQHFWRRWRQEYLHTLIQRQKWSGPTDKVKIGDVVVLNSENTPPTRWPLARIVELLPHSDGEIRVVKIRTSSGTLTRPVRKLLILPVCN